MPAKFVHIAEIGTVAMYKRRGVNGVRLSIAHDGTVRVMLPSWAPYRLGIEFVRTKTEWILAKRQPKHYARANDRVGKAHRFIFEQRDSAQTVSTRISGTDIKIIIPSQLTDENSSVQIAAEKAAIRALKKEGEQLLPQRLRALALQHGFSYTSVNIKRLRSRWGSCNEKKDIVLNCFLMQLPWHLIDYVLLHELVHTTVLRHGEPFWSEVSRYVNNLPAIRKEMKQYQPTLMIMPGETLSEQAPYQVAIIDAT